MYYNRKKKKKINRIFRYDNRAIIIVTIIYKNLFSEGRDSEKIDFFFPCNLKDIENRALIVIVIITIYLVFFHKTGDN